MFKLYYCIGMIGEIDPSAELIAETSSLQESKDKADANNERNRTSPLSYTLDKPLYSDKWFDYDDVGGKVTYYDLQTGVYYAIEWD